MGQSIFGKLVLAFFDFGARAWAFHGRGVTDDASRFEAFDEPWKIMLDSPGREWEDKWGLMDTARNLKPGLKIPDCGGKTV
jgi:hypothetical protein